MYSYNFKTKIYVIRDIVLRTVRMGRDLKIKSKLGVAAYRKN